MKLKLTNWKHLPGEYEAEAQTLLADLYGRTGTAAIEAIQFVLLGTIPRLGGLDAIAQAYVFADRAKIVLETNKGVITRTLRSTEDSKFKSTIYFDSFCGDTAEEMIKEKLNSQVWAEDLYAFDRFSPGRKLKTLNTLIDHLSPGWERMPEGMVNLIKEYSNNLGINAAISEALSAIEMRLKYSQSLQDRYETDRKILSVAKERLKVIRSKKTDYEADDESADVK